MTFAVDWALSIYPSVCWAILLDVFRGLGPVPGHICHLRSLHVGQYCRMCSGVWVQFLAISGISDHCMLGSIVGCVLAISGISDHCMLGSIVGCVQGFRVQFLAIYVTSEHCMLGSVVGCVQGFGVQILPMPGISESCMSRSVAGCVQGFGVHILPMPGI